MNGISNALDPHSPQAAMIADLWWRYFGIMATVFVLVVVAVFIGLRRRAPADDRRSLRVVIGATAVTVAALFTLLAWTVRASRFVMQVPDESAASIEVVGQQWWWQVRYLDAQANRIVTTANEIHIPVGQPVVLLLRTADVIHSFWVPSLHGKRDLIPGQINTLTLQADSPGTYHGQCAEFCGAAHAQMAFVVIAESPADYARWLEHQRQSAPPPMSEEAKRGQEIFATTACALCHGIQGTSASANVAPDLTHVASRQAIGSGVTPYSRAHMAEWIRHNQTIKPGNHMPDINLPDADLQAVTAYLDTLR